MTGRAARAALVASSFLLASCSSSTLAEDDQAFCSEQEDRLDLAFDQIVALIAGDRHWSSDGESYAIREVYFEPASNFIDAFEPQDAGLKKRVDELSSSLFYVHSALLGVDGDEEVFANDAEILRTAGRELLSLREFCDENG
jgi:hypothetical protein